MHFSENLVIQLKMHLFEFYEVAELANRLWIMQSNYLVQYVIEYRDQKIHMLHRLEYVSLSMKE